MPTKTMPQGAFGTRELQWRDFAGLVEDVDASQLPASLASAALNVDFSPAGLSKRKGKLAIQPALEDGGVRGVSAYYPNDGSDSILLAASATVVLAFPPSGGANALKTGQTGSHFTQFAGFRDRVYSCNGSDLPQRWDGVPTDAAEIAANPSAPLGLALERGFTLIENFAAAAGWVSSESPNLNNLTFADAFPAGGSTVLKLTAASGVAEGLYGTKPWSAGAAVDLSTFGSISFTALAQKSMPSFPAPTFRYGILLNDSTIYWLGYFNLTQEGVWQEVVFDITGIPPADRTASKGQVIGWTDSASGGGYPQYVEFSGTYAVAPLPADTYSYFATCVDTDRGMESAPAGLDADNKATVTVLLPVGHQSSSIDLSVLATSQTGVDEIHLWRHGDLSTFPQAKRIKVLTNVPPVALLGATNASPVVAAVPAGHGLVTGDTVVVAGALGNTGANGTWPLTVAGNNLTLTGSVGNGVWTSGGTVTKLLQFSDTRSDADLLLAFEPDLMTRYQIDPPRSRTLAVVRNRLLAGAVTVAGELIPWRIYLSRYGHPEGMTSSQNPADPLAGGYIDLPDKDTIIRVVDVDGAAVIFCERSIWTLEGTGWDDFDLRKRASVGLDAFNAVAVYGRAVFFLASDGVRVLECRFGLNGVFNTWVLSEPVGDRLRDIPTAYRQNAAFGLDERQRLHVSYTASGATVNDAALVLDLRAPGALDPGRNFLRPGWTAYSSWGYSCFTTLKRGGGDVGQMIGGDPTLGRLWHCQVGADGNDLEADSQFTDIDWSWTSAAFDHGTDGIGQPGNLGTLAAALDPAAGEAVTLAAILDRDDTSPLAYARDLGSRTSGMIAVLVRTKSKRFRWLQVRVSGSNDVAMRVRSVAAGIYG